MLAKKNVKQTNSRLGKWFSGPEKSKKLALIVLVLIFAGIGVWQLVFSHASGFGDGTIRPNNSGRCINPKDFGTYDKVPIQIWDCIGGNNDKWTRFKDGQIMSVNSSKCLYAYGSYVGSPIVIYSCSGVSNQVFDTYGDGTIRQRSSGLCLDVANYGTANGSRLQLYTCLGGSNQKFNVGMTDLYMSSLIGNYNCQTTATLKQNSGSSACIKAVQYGLNNWNRIRGIGGPTLKVDGKFGTATTNMVKIYQAKYLLTADGVVGPATWNQFLNDCAFFGYCSNAPGK